MTKPYQATLKTQARRLRNTSILSVILGLFITHELLLHHHRTWALIVAIVTVQVAVGSYIMMGDIKRDLKEIKRTGSLSA